MLTLKPDECRVLGVLIEKALTTPQQYPLTLNALTTGCNQKNNRFPVVDWDEDRVLNAVDSLRIKGLVREALLTGSRVAKYRHLAREVLEVDTAQLVLLAELWLRGPQSVGDLRQHASRMHAFESLEQTQSILDGMIARQPALVKEYPPPAGSRAKLYAQLYCETLHRIEARTATPGELADESDDNPKEGTSPALLSRIDALEREVQSLRGEMDKLKAALGV